MSLLSKLFSKKSNPRAELAKNINDRLQEVGKPRGIMQSAIYGSEIRHRVFDVIEKVEADIGQMAVAYAEKEGVLMVNPKLTEKIIKLPDASIIDSSLPLCFLTPDAKRRLNSSWASWVAGYHDKPNTKTILKEKAAMLSTYIVYNLDLTTEIYARNHPDAPELTEEQIDNAKIEEASCWCRIIDELAYQMGAEDRHLFMDYFGEQLAELLALQGSPPDIVYQTLTDRMKEYGKYLKWVPTDSEGAKGTLFWEAAKHIRSAIDAEKDALFLIELGLKFLERIEIMSVGELLTGRS